MRASDPFLRRGALKKKKEKWKRVKVTRQNARVEVPKLATGHRPTAWCHVRFNGGQTQQDTGHISRASRGGNSSLGKWWKLNSATKNNTGKR